MPSSKSSADDGLNRKQRYEKKRSERYANYQELVKERDSITDKIRKMAIDRAIDAHYSKERDAHERRMAKQRELRAAKQ